MTPAHAKSHNVNREPCSVYTEIETVLREVIKTKTRGTNDVAFWCHPDIQMQLLDLVAGCSDTQSVLKSQLIIG